MQKFFVIFVLLCAFFMVSCGDGSSSKTDGTGNGGSSAAKTGKLGGECYPNETCDKGLICDTENNVCVKDPENPADDSDKTDSGSDGKTDTGSENGDTDSTDSGHENHDSGDSQPDDSDTSDSGSDSGDLQPANDADQGDSQSGNDTDPGDSQPDDDNADSEDDSSEDLNPLNLPVCSKTSGTPCIYKGLLIWSAKSPERKRWIDAVEHCKKLTEGGFNDWRLPDVDLLGTLVQNCDSAGYGCTGNSNGDYSVFGDITFFWSTYEYGNSQAGGVYFYNASTQLKNVDETFDVRCVRIETTSVNKKCDEIPENAVYNSVSKITQTWDWETYWTPSTEATYSEETSTTECRFKCEDNYFWDSNSTSCLNPCDSNPCVHGICTATNATEYSCECEDNYFFDSDSGKCLNPCEPNPCTRIVETGICIAESAKKYSCECKENYYHSGKCSNPCDGHHYCFGITNSVCTPKSSETYECSGGYDPETKLTWSDKALGARTWEKADLYCRNLTESGYSDWRLPTISELRTLIVYCDNLKTDGSCGVYDGCLAYTCSQYCMRCMDNNGAPYYSINQFNKFEDFDIFWSSSVLSDDSDQAWIVSFELVTVNNIFYPTVNVTVKNKSAESYVRCVRSEN